MGVISRPSFSRRLRSLARGGQPLVSVYRIMQSRQCRHSRWSMRPSVSMAWAPQPTAQALQLLQSCLRLRPNQRNVLGMASDAPNGQMYLQ